MMHTTDILENHAPLHVIRMNNDSYAQIVLK